MSNETTTGPAEAGDDINAGCSWAEVEIFGHRRRLGRIREVERFGGAFLEVTFWDEATDRQEAELYGAGSIFSVRLCSEAEVLADIARRKQMKAEREERIRRWSLPSPDEWDDGQEDERDDGQEDERDDGQEDERDDGQEDERDDGQEDERDDGQEDERTPGDAFAGVPAPGHLGDINGLGMDPDVP